MTLGTPIPKKLTIEELRSATRGRLGIVIGPGATTADGQFWTKLAESIARQFNVESRPSFHETAELAVHEGATSEAVREVVAGYASAVPASPVLSQLAKIRWTAIISCAMDDQFETRLEQEHLRRPARADVAILSDIRCQALAWEQSGQRSRPRRGRTCPKARPVAAGAPRCGAGLRWGFRGGPESCVSLLAL